MVICQSAVSDEPAIRKVRGSVAQIKGSPAIRSGVLIFSEIGVLDRTDRIGPSHGAPAQTCRIIRIRAVGVAKKAIFHLNGSTSASRRQVQTEGTIIGCEIRINGTHRPTRISRRFTRKTSVSQGSLKRCLPVLPHRLKPKCLR